MIFYKIKEADSRRNMFKTVAKDVWAFDVEWVPDADAGRRLHQLPHDVEESEVFEAMWKAGGAS